MNIGKRTADSVWTTGERGNDGAMRRLLPLPAEEISVAEAYAEALGAHADRPWITVCMVASIDGATAVATKSAGLSNPTDRSVMAQLRAISDVIVVGAGTARHEGYHPPKKPGQRVGVVSCAGNIDLGSELFASGAGFLITSSSASFPVPAGLDVVRAGEGVVDLDQALRRLGDVVDECRVAQVEGGPTLNSALLDRDLFDELNVTTSAITAGGDSQRLIAGAAHVTRPFELAQLAIDEESFLFARWLRRRSG